MIYRPSKPRWPDAKWAFIYAAGTNGIKILTEDGESGHYKGKKLAQLINNELSYRDRWCVFTNTRMWGLVSSTGDRGDWIVHKWNDSWSKAELIHFQGGPSFGMIVYPLSGMREIRDRASIFRAMNEYCRWSRQWAGAIGKPGYIGSHSWYRTLSEPIKIRTRRGIPNAMYGGRKECYSPGRHEDVTYLDIAAAYPWALSKVSIPESITPTDGTDLTGNGIVKARVNIPRTSPLPLPVRRGKKDIVWGHGNAYGAWPLNEVRLAVSHGTKILRVDGVWKTSGERPGLFDDWLYGAVMSARHIKDKNARSLAKRATNSLWGSFAMKGRNTKHKPSAKSVTGDMELVDYGSFWLSPARPIGSIVSAEVRCKLYEKLSNSIYADTDGVMIEGDTEPTDYSPGQWRPKKRMECVELWAAQSYRYYNGKRWRYSVAGIPENVARTGFELIKEPLMPQRTRKVDNVRPRERL